MTKLQDSAHSKQEVDLGLRDLYMERAIAKWEVILELEYVTPLLEVSSEEANNVAIKVSDSIKEVESYVKYFRLAHEIYMQKIKEYATGGKKIRVSILINTTTRWRRLKDECTESNTVDRKYIQ